MMGLRWIGERVGVCIFVAAADAAPCGGGCVALTVQLASLPLVMALFPTASEPALPGVFMVLLSLSLPATSLCTEAATTAAAAAAMALALSDRRNGAGDTVSGARVLLVDLPTDFAPLAAGVSAFTVTSFLSSGGASFPEAAQAAAAAADRPATPPSPLLFPTEEPLLEPGGEGHGVSGRGVLAASAAAAAAAAVGAAIGVASEAAARLGVSF